MNHIQNYVKNYFIGSSSRSRTIVKNIGYIFFIKGISIVVSFLVIPITLEYVGKPMYGIWLTMFSIVSWLSLFDVGLGNGLRNKLSAAIAKKNKFLAAQYVATTYFAMTCISIVLFLIIYIISYRIDWIKILRLPLTYQYDITKTILILSLFFCVRFIVQLISAIFFAIQKAFMVDLIGLLGNIFSLIAIYYGKAYFLGDRLLFLVYALCLPPIIVMIISSICLFGTKKYKFLCPQSRNIKSDKIRSLVNLGMKFFILQMCGLLTYSMTNFLILQFLSADDVTYYNLTYKYFSALLILNNMICAPLWSAFTEAYTLNDFIWIERCVAKMRRVFVGICLLGMLMLILSPQFYQLWLNNLVHIPFLLSLVMLLYILTSCFNGIVIAFINGIGKVRLQTYLAIASTIIFVPVCHTLAINLKMGVVGFILYMFVSNLMIASIAAIQTNKIIKRTASGIWNK